MNTNNEAASILSDFNLILGQIDTIQGAVHNILVRTALFAFKNKGAGADLVAKVLNNTVSRKGSFRVESVAYWFTEVAGIKAAVKGDVYLCSYNKDKSVLGIPFTYDVKHLEQVKLVSNRFWTIAPVVLKTLKLPGDVEKCTSSAEIMLARGLAGGTLSKEDIQAHLANMLSRVSALAEGSKTKEWLEEFHMQNPKEVSSPSIEELLEAEFNQARIEELDTVNID